MQKYILYLFYANFFLFFFNKTQENSIKFLIFKL